MIPDKAQPETIEGLLMALQEKGFVYKIRVEVEYNAEDRPVQRKLIQI
jgi:hypothetical protein